MSLATAVLIVALVTLTLSESASDYRVVGSTNCAAIVPVEWLEVSRAVFTGSVLDVKESKGIQTVKFELIQSWKYVRTKQVTIINELGTERPNFRKGESYLVFAYGLRKGKLATGMCSAKRFEYAREEIQVLDRWLMEKKSKSFPK